VSEAKSTMEIRSRSGSVTMAAEPSESTVKVPPLIGNGA